MKTLSILKKIFHWTLVLIVCMSLTSCPSKKDDNTPTEEHCTSNSTISRQIAMTSDNYVMTYYSFQEGNKISLCYLSNNYTSICPDKLIGLKFQCLLEYYQDKEISVVAQVFWGNEASSSELQLDSHNDLYNGWRVFSYDGTIDVSNYYLTGGSADITLKVFFKFLSTYNNTADQNYLKSKFISYYFQATYYPY